MIPSALAHPKLLRLRDMLNLYIVPLGWVLMLTGLFWVGKRSAYHQVFYVFMLLPTVIAIVIQPRLLKQLTRNPMFIVLAIFSVYMLLTLLWSTSEESSGSLIKRPIYIAVLLFAVGISTLKAPQRLEIGTCMAAIFAAAAALVSTLWFLHSSASFSDRLAGYGALYNPLLTAHVLGAFASYWLCCWFLTKSPINPLPLLCMAALGAAIIATGSRTPMVGLSAALIWLCIVGNKKRAAFAIGMVVLLLVSLWFVYPEAFTQRGVSYRPAIWAESLRQISLKPWLGYGFDYPMVVPVAGLDEPLYDPHNIELGVLYAGGIVGFVLWMALYGLAMGFCWKHRREPAVIIAGCWLFYGFAAGLTEGNAFMSRPKEHWFLIWMPMALVYGQWVLHAARKKSDGNNNVAAD